MLRRYTAQTEDHIKSNQCLSIKDCTIIREDILFEANRNSLWATKNVKINIFLMIYYWFYVGRQLHKIRWKVNLPDIMHFYHLSPGSGKLHRSGRRQQINPISFENTIIWNVFQYSTYYTCIWHDVANMQPAVFTSFKEEDTFTLTQRKFDLNEKCIWLAVPPTIFLKTLTSGCTSTRQTLFWSKTLWMESKLVP